jgi:hypothetical protein
MADMTYCVELPFAMADDGLTPGEAILGTDELAQPLLATARLSRGSSEFGGGRVMDRTSGLVGLRRAPAYGQKIFKALHNIQIPSQRRNGIVDLLRQAEPSAS